MTYWVFKPPLRGLFDTFSLLEISETFTYFPMTPDTIKTYFDISNSCDHQWCRVARVEEINNWWRQYGV